MFKIAVTGHRPDKLGGYDRNNPLRRALRQRFTELALCLIGVHLLETDDNRAVVYLGMALGFDQDVACACIRAEIPFVACVPFRGQEKRWPQASQDDYHAIMSKAANVWVGSEEAPATERGAAFLMQQRNEYMVDQADVIIACWDGSNGGTANCVTYASTKCKRIYYIDPRREFGKLCPVEAVEPQRKHTGPPLISKFG